MVHLLKMVIFHGYVKSPDGNLENEYWLFKVNIQTMNEILHQLVNTVWVTTKPRPYHWIGTYIPSTNCQGSVHHNRFMAYACSVCTVYVYNLFLIDVKKLVIWLLDIRILYIYIYIIHIMNACVPFSWADFEARCPNMFVEVDLSQC